MFGRRSEHILIVKTDGLAAFVAAEPAFEAIRAAHPRAKISLLTTAGLQRVARAAPYFDQVAALPNLRDPEARKIFIGELRSQRIARVYDLSADEEARRLHSAMGVSRPKWISADPPARGRKGAAASSEPNLDRVFDAAGAQRAPRLPDFTWALSARKDSANMQPSWFGISGSFGLLLPGPDPERRWPATHYAKLAQTMARAQVMPVLAGGKDLHAFGDEIAHEAPEIVDLSGKTDHLQLVALAQEAAFFVTDHAEEAHLALSVRCRGVAIRKAKDAPPAPDGRDMVLLTAREDLAEAKPDFVWRTLHNMGLVPDPKAARAAAAR